MTRQSLEAAQAAGYAIRLPARARLARALGQQDHYFQFRTGRIRLSTLAACRTMEDVTRRDEHEGQDHHFGTPVSGDSGDAALEYQASRLGFALGPDCTNFTISGGWQKTTDVDGWVLCFHDEAQGAKVDSYGKHVVRLRNPVGLFHRIRHQLQREGITLQWSALCYVKYGRQHTVGLERPIGVPGFVKAPRFEPDREVRMVWVPEDRTLLAPGFRFVQVLASGCIESN